MFIKYKDKSHGDTIEKRDIRIGDVVTLNNGKRGKVSDESRYGFSMRHGKGGLECFYPGVVVRIERWRTCRVRIYQIEPLDREYAFMGYSYVKSKRRAAPPAELYQIAFDGDIGTDQLEEIFRIFNVEHPKGYKGRSLSVSDIVELYDEQGSRFYYCDSFGFKKIRFKPVCSTNPIPNAADIAFPCCLHEADRTLDWCERNCGKYYSCDTVAMALDDLKAGDGEL